MDNKVLAGVIVGLILIVAVTGVILYNYNFSTPKVNNTNTTNNDTNSTPPSSNELTLFLPTDNQPRTNSGPGPNPKPSPGPNSNPDPDPNPDSINHIISLFDAYLKSYYNQSLVPGMAVVIVQDGKIIYINTLGVKNLASGEPVDQNTLFGIGSATKQFAATNVAQLISAGLMSWDDPISKYYNNIGEFKLYNDYITNTLTIRDSFSHRSGLPATGGDDYYTYFNDTFSATLYKLRYMENNTPFRSTFAYNNVIYCLPAYSAARVNNLTWNDLIKKNLLDPLEMTTTATSYWDFLNSSNHATPYKLLKNGTLKEYDIIPDPVGPAGSIYSSISEMANWLRFQIAGTGMYNGVQIVSKKDLDETRTPQISVTGSLSGYGSKYGLGWFISDDNINHAGDSDSFHSMVTVYPSKGLGMVILTNGGPYANILRSSLYIKFVELLKGNETYDPWPDLKKSADTSWKPVPPTPPIINQTLPLGGYVGVYSHNLFSNINITTSNNTLICYYGNDSRPFDLNHWNGDIFEEPTNNHFFNFTNIYNGTAHQVNVKLTNTPEVTFNRTNST